MVLLNFSLSMCFVTFFVVVARCASSFFFLFFFIFVTNNRSRSRRTALVLAICDAAGVQAYTSRIALRSCFAQSRFVMYLCMCVCLCVVLQYLIVQIITAGLVCCQISEGRLWTVALVRMVPNRSEITTGPCQCPTVRRVYSP